MPKRGRLICVSLWILAPLIAGVAAGLGASKSLWDYWWIPPTVHIDPTSHPRAIAFFHRWPSLEVQPILVRNEVLSNELTHCSGGQIEDCTFGRVLLKTRNVSWTTLPMLADSAVQSALNSAQHLSRVAVVKEGKNVTGVVAIYDLHGETLTLVTFDTGELKELGQDTHVHAEILLRGSGGEIALSDSKSYQYEIAGIEFATPRVLVILGIILAYMATATYLALRSTFRNCG